MKSKIPSYLRNQEQTQYELVKVKRAKLSFLDSTILNSANAIKSVYLQAESGAKENFLQKINPHVKLISLIYLAIVISVVSNLQSQIFISVFVFSLYITGRFKVIQVY